MGAGLAAALALAGGALAASGDITTVAGTGVSGGAGDGGPAASAQLERPVSVTFDPAGNYYIADKNQKNVRKVNTSGTISTLDMGSFTMSQPHDVEVDSSGNVYVADKDNHRILRRTPSGAVTVFGGTGGSSNTGDGGPATSAGIQKPAGLEIYGGYLYIASLDGAMVRRINLSTGTISAVAGIAGAAGNSGDGGAATSAKLNKPEDIAADSAGNIYIADGGNHKVRKVNTSGVITTYAGTGSAGSSGDGGAATSAQLNVPGGIAVDGANSVFVAEGTGDRIRKIPTSGTISTIAGTGASGFSGDGGPATSAKLDKPTRMDANAAGDLYYASENNRRVRRVEAAMVPLATAPTVSGVIPASPANDNSPKITGSAASGSTVKLYTNSTCTSSVAGSGTAAAYSSPGVAVSVSDDSTTTFWATATVSGTESSCSSTSVTYTEDSTAPASPSLGSGPGATGSNPVVSWSFSGDAGATFECQLTRGSDVVSAWATCTSPRSYNLVSEIDGTYTFSVRSKDAAGNQSSATTSQYILDRAPPAAPSITSNPGSVGKVTSPSWAFSGESGASFECRVVDSSNNVEFDWASCSSPKSYNLASAG
ncbi:MAG: hypothetical protein ACR2NA_08995, partial [Solirubrobacterales bacterium]